MPKNAFRIVSVAAMLSMILGVSAGTTSSSTTTTTGISSTTTSTLVPTKLPSCPSPQKYICGSCRYIDNRDCRGVCLGPSDQLTYTIDCTGQCVPVGLARAYDSCGICGGSGTSCLDCNGVINGTSVRDYCGVCDGSGGSCGFMWDRIEPTVIPNNGKAVVSVFGSGLLSSSVTAELFTNDTLPVYVSALTVNVVSNQQIQIKFDAVSVNSTLTSFLVRMYSVQNATFLVNVISQRTMVMAVNPVKLYIQQKIPSTIASCQDLVFDMSLVTNSGGRPFVAGNITFSTSGTTPSADQALQATLNTQIGLFLSGTQMLKIPAAQLSSTTYSFTITLKNFMESVGSTTVSVTKSPADTVPNVKIIGPVGLAEVNEVITLQAVFQSSCGSAVNAQPSFQWSYYAGPDGFVYSIDPSMTNLDSLSFAPFTFSTNQNYTFMLSVSVGAGEPYFFEYTISTASDEILTLPIESNAVMFVGNAMISSSASDPSDSSNTPLSYQWSCVVVSSNQKCSQFFSESALADSTLLLSQILLAGAYLFYFNVWNSNTLSKALSAPIFVTLVDDPIPLVTLSLNAEYISPWSDSVYISSKVTPNSTSVLSKDLVYSWYSLTSCGQNIGAVVLNLSDSNIALTQNTSQLKISPGVLIPGGIYCLGVNVWEPASPRPGNATLSFQVLSGPKSGSCSTTSLKIGKAFVTLFQFQCFGWVTDTVATPLYYTWEVKPATSSWSLVSEGSSPLFQSTFPAGQYIIRANVTDKFGGRNQIPQLISINVLTYNRKREILAERASTMTPVDYFNNVIVANYKEFSSSSTALSQCSLLAKSAPSSSLSDALNLQLQIDITTFAANIVKSGIFIDETNYGPVLISLMQSLSAVWAPSLTYPSDLLASTLLSIIQKLNKNTMNSNECLNRDLGIQLMTIVASIISNLSPSGGSTAFSSTFSSILDLLDPCLQKSIACGEPPILVSSSTYSREIGVIALKPSITLCGGAISVSTDYVPTLSQSANGCVAYSCSKYGILTSLIGSSSMNFSNSAISVTLRLAPGFPPLTFSTGGSFNISNTTMPSLFPLSIRVPISGDVSDSVAKGNSTISCTIVDNSKSSLPDTSKNWNSTACFMTDYDANSALCKCSTIGLVGIVVSKVAQPTLSLTTATPTASPQPSPTGSNEGDGEKPNVAVIVGACLGTAVFVAFLGYLYDRKQRRKRRKLVNSLNDIVMPPQKPTRMDNSERNSRSTSAVNSTHSTVDTIHVPAPLPDDMPPPGLGKADPRLVSELLAEQELQSLVNPNTLSLQSLNTDMSEKDLERRESNGGAFASLDSFKINKRRQESRVYPVDDEGMGEAMKSQRPGSAGQTDWPFTI